MDRDIEGRGDTGFEPGMGAGQHGIDKVKDKANAIAGEVRDTATEKLESQKSRAAGTLSGVARSLRASGEQLEGDQYGAGQYIRQAADQVEKLAGYLQARDVSDMLDQAEDFARRQPALFVGAAFALGLTGARFLKSSRERLEREEMREGRDNRHLPEPMSDFGRGRSSRPSRSSPDGSAYETTPDAGPFAPAATGGVGYGSPSPDYGVGYAAAPESTEEVDDSGTTERPQRRPR